MISVQTNPMTSTDWINVANCIGARQRHLGAYAAAIYRADWLELQDAKMAALGKMVTAAIAEHKEATA